MNVLTVGDLCSLTEQEVHHLPIVQPKVLNVRRAMNKFAAWNHRNAGDVYPSAVGLSVFWLLFQFTAVASLVIHSSYKCTG